MTNFQLHKQSRIALSFTVLLAAACTLTCTPGALAALVINDPSIIVLLKLDEQTTGTLVNGPGDNSFIDTAVSGTPDNHQGFTAPAPDYGSGTAFQNGGSNVGTGTGLIFDRTPGERTRFRAWAPNNAPAYTDGESFTVMVRVFIPSPDPITAYDNQTLDLTGNGAHGISINGASFGGGSISARVRGGGGGAPFFDINTATGSEFIFPDRWTNIFLIYNKNTSLTIAIDDDTSGFRSVINSTLPGGFDSTGGFEDGANAWLLGARNNSIGNTFPGLIESLVVFNRALTLSEADAINLTNVPEPAALTLLSLAGLMMTTRRRQQKT